MSQNSVQRRVTVGQSNVQTNRQCASVCHLFFLSIFRPRELDLARQTSSSLAKAREGSGSEPWLAKMYKRVKVSFCSYLQHRKKQIYSVKSCFYIWFFSVPPDLNMLMDINWSAFEYNTNIITIIFIKYVSCTKIVICFISAKKNG